MDPMIVEAIDCYHEALARRSDFGPSLLQAYLEEERRQQVCYGGEPLRTLLRPHFVSEEQRAELQRTIPLICSVLEQAVRFYLSHAETRRYIVLRDEVDRMVRIPSRLQTNVVVARLDAFDTVRGTQFIEFNADSPAGPGNADVQEQILQDMGLLQGLSEHFEVVRQSRCQLLLRALLEAFAAHDVSGEPHMVITDWEEVSTFTEFLLLQEYFERAGVPTEIADPRALEYSAGRLVANGKPVNLVYRRVLLREMLGKIDECQALVQAAEQGTACIVNPFCSVIAGTKDVCYLMFDEGFRSRLTSDEIAAVERHVPWTCHVGNEPVSFEGRSWLPVELAAAHKDRFVLKPAGGYGGRDVFVGHETATDQWERQLKTYQERSWVLQQLVPIPEEPYPVDFTAGLTVAPRKVNLNPYAFGGRYGGSIARLSTSSVINVSAGGGVVPTLEIRPRATQ